MLRLAAGLMVVGLILLCFCTQSTDENYIPISFESATSLCLENIGSVAIKVVLPTAVDQDISATYSIASTSAFNITDYSSTQSSVTIRAGSTSANINIQIVNDSIRESDDTLIISLSNPQYGVMTGTLGTISRHTLIIHDDSNDVATLSSFPFVSKIQYLTPIVQTLRGLTFKRPLKVCTMTRAEYAAQTTINVSSSMDNTEANSLSRELLQMGFVATIDTNLQETYSNYLSSFPAAWYVSGTDSIYFISQTVAENSLMAEPIFSEIVAHEMTHALQDQNLGLHFTAYPGYSYYNSDSYFAKISLFEGDASFIQALYWHKYVANLSTNISVSMVKNFYANYALDFLAFNIKMDTPIYLDVKHMGPYDVGPDYVGSKVSSSGDYSQVNSAFSIAGVPRSTAEIITKSPTNLFFFEFGRIQEQLIAAHPSAVFVDDDNVGALGLLGLFYKDIESSVAIRAMGYLGDRYTYIIDQGEHQGALVWTLCFTSSNDARYMFNKFHKLITHRVLGDPGTTISSIDSVQGTTSGDVTYTYTASAWSGQLHKNGSQVWWIENAGTLKDAIVSELIRQKNLGKSRTAIASPVFPCAMMPVEKKNWIMEMVVSRCLKKL